MQSLLIIVGVGVGVSVIVFMSALLSGLQSNLVRRTLSSQAHIVLMPPEEVARPLRQGDANRLGPLVQKQAQRLRPIDQWQKIRDRLSTLPEIAAVSPIAAGPAFAVRGDANKSVTLLGIEAPNSAGQSPCSDRFCRTRRLQRAAHQTALDPAGTTRFCGPI
jgi:lipoprotein-releasing system permease protein